MFVNPHTDLLIQQSEPPPHTPPSSSSYPFSKDKDSNSRNLSPVFKTQLYKIMGEVMVATADVYTVKFNRCNISRHLGTIPTFESVLC